MECTDTVLVEMNKAVAADCLRRPLRLFQRLEDKAGEDSRSAGGGAGAGQPSKYLTYFLLFLVKRRCDALKLF